MPTISITEQEKVSFTAFDATENVVLIPMLYARSLATDENNNITGYKEEAGPASKHYTSYSEFANDMRGHYVYVDSDSTPDRSYIMAYELLLQGLSVVVKPILFDNIEFFPEDSEGNRPAPGDLSSYHYVLTQEQAYRYVEAALTGHIDPTTGTNTFLEEFEDRNLFNIKFITSGGYANCGPINLYSEEEEREITVSLSSYNALGNLAATRGDAVALIEYRPLFNSKEELLRDTNQTISFPQYSAAFLPWCLCNVTDVNGPFEMPASYCYLAAYARSVSYNANWFAAAGVSRGQIPTMVKPLFEVGEALMHILQGDTPYTYYEGSTPVSYSTVVNPIYNAGTYGYRIWGNRVALKSPENIYRKFLNVRILLCDIKKQIYHAAMRVTFEPNDDIVWVNFKTLASSPLERMKSGRGITWYKWTREYINEKGKIKATLTIRPIEAVESFDINVVLTDEEATVEEASVL